MDRSSAAFGAGLLAVLALAAPVRADEPVVRAGVAGLRLSLPGARLRLLLAGRGADDALHGRRPDRSGERKDRVLLHGKNFCAATWESTIRALSAAGWRVVAPDQIGFCKSAKPERYQYSFHQLAENTHALLAALGVKDPVIVGHSTGGMIAARYALMYPGDVSALVLVNPIGLEDWKALGVPALSVDQWIEREKGPRPSASGPTSRRPITPASGVPNTTAGWRCLRASCRGRATTSSPATSG